ncbi:CocE/NonD family hydrolase [Pedobacter frigoris]|uniref:CocE/NonD family hydrolase n=1 Tax=Pedobacter frigoris TaxID=2571272 RepID=UPI002931249D|nr:CocE/NonD family hydrolase [Pedobacter frigoris]
MMKIRYIFSTLLLLITLSVKSQQFYFPKAAYADTAKLKTAMSALSLQILAKLDKIKDKEMSDIYLQSVNQSISGQYRESLNSINRLRDEVIKGGKIDTGASFGVMFINECYNQIRLMQAEGRGAEVSIEELFKITFPIALENLGKLAKTIALEPFSMDVSAIEKQWQVILEKRRSLQKDSLSLDEADDFSQAYFQHWLYSRFVPVGKKVLSTLDNSNYIIQDSVMIKMRDGVELSAVIVRSKKTELSQPVVLIANIYSGPGEVEMAKEIVNNGYTGVILNTRGKYVSDAMIEPFEHDANDVYDAINWISQQSWCNGKVGMYGGSYLGFTQWAATKVMHPALKTIVPQVAAAPGIDFPMHNNTFTTYMLRWLNNVTASKGTEWAEFSNIEKWDQTFNNWYLSNKPFHSLDSIEGRPNTIFQRWLKHPSYDAYWQKMIPYKEEFRKINIPVLSITGYFDGDQKGALYYFKEHNFWNPKANHYLVIGPYDHGGAQGSPSPLVNGYPIDQSAKIDISKLVFRWFDYILKDSVKPELLKEKVNYQVMDENQWKHAASLKTMNNGSLQFYLSPLKNGQLNKLVVKPEANAVIQQQREFLDRKKEKVSDTYKLLEDSLDVDGRLGFVSEVFDRDFSINGSFTAELYAAINKKDMDISVQLVEQRADGKCFSLSTSLQRASYSKNRSKRELITPNIVSHIPVTGSFISKKISKGSRLVFLIGIPKGAYVQINYGTGKDVSVESVADGKEPLRIKWSGKSSIHIPVQRN